MLEKIPVLWLWFGERFKAIIAENYFQHIFMNLFI